MTTQGMQAFVMRERHENTPPILPSIAQSQRMHDVSPPDAPYAHGTEGLSPDSEESVSVAVYIAHLSAQSSRASDFMISYLVFEIKQVLVHRLPSFVEPVF